VEVDNVSCQASGDTGDLPKATWDAASRSYSLLKRHSRFLEATQTAENSAIFFAKETLGLAQQFANGT